MMNLIKGERGFTLIELLVVVVILGLVITAVLNINLGGFKFLLLNRDRIKLQDEARLITTNLEREIRSSKGAENISVDSDDQSLKLITKGESIVFYVDNNNFKIGFLDPTIDTSTGISSTSLDDVRNITNGVVIESHEFSVEGDDLVYFNLNLSKDNTTYQISNKFYPRAKL